MTDKIALAKECEALTDFLAGLDTEADDGKPQRGWHAIWQTRCDCCGRFVREGGSGVSWSQQWSYDYEGTPDLHDPTFRCSPCTDEHGVKPTNCNETNGGKYHGRNP